MRAKDVRMTDTPPRSPRNEAAERLREDNRNGMVILPDAMRTRLEDIRAEERRHVIEQIRDKVGPLPIVSFHTMKYAEVLEALTRFMTALDAVEADR